MKATGYIRSRTIDENGNAVLNVISRDRQREAIERYAADNGYEIEHWVEDGGGHVGWEWLMKYAPDEAIIACSADRFTRDGYKFYAMREELKGHGVRLVLVNETTPMEDLFFKDYGDK